MYYKTDYNDKLILMEKFKKIKSYEYLSIVTRNISSLVPDVTKLMNAIASVHSSSGNNIRTQYDLRKCKIAKSDQKSRHTHLNKINIRTIEFNIYKFNIIK